MDIYISTFIYIYIYIYNPKETCVWILRFYLDTYVSRGCSLCWIPPTDRSLLNSYCPKKRPMCVQIRPVCRFYDSIWIHMSREGVVSFGFYLQTGLFCLKKRPLCVQKRPVCTFYDSIWIHMSLEGLVSFGFYLETGYFWFRSVLKRDLFVCKSDYESKRDLSLSYRDRDTYEFKRYLNVHHIQKKPFLVRKRHI